jgi:hypothetical protein
MSVSLIQFTDRADEAAGLVALARRTSVDALPGGVYRVRREDLSILRELKLGFRIASIEEARQAAEGVHDPAAAQA